MASHRLAWNQQPGETGEVLMTATSAEQLLGGDDDQPEGHVSGEAAERDATDALVASAVVVVETRADVLGGTGSRCRSSDRSSCAP